MKTATKIVVALSVAMIVLGGGLATVAWAISGGNIGVVWNSGYAPARVRSGLSSTYLESGSTDPGAFQSINLDTDYGTVKLIPADSYRVEYNLLADFPKPEISVSGGTLTVRNTPKTINGYNNLHSIDQAYLYVYYPQAAALTDITLKSGLGKISLQNVSASGKINLVADLGSIELRSVKAQTVEIDADLGSVTLDGVTADSLDFNLAMGELDATNCTLTNGATITNDMGSVMLSGDISGDVEIACSMGSVDFRTSRAGTDYFLDVSAELGGATVDGRKFHAGDGGPSSAPYTLTVDTDVGGVDIRFAQ